MTFQSSPTSPITIRPIATSHQLDFSKNSLACVPDPVRTAMVQQNLARADAQLAGS